MNPFRAFTHWLCLLATACAALLLRANADTGTGQSGNISVDTRGTASANAVTVTGRVLSQTNGAALPGASISITTAAPTSRNISRAPIRTMRIRI